MIEGLSPNPPPRGQAPAGAPTQDARGAYVPSILAQAVSP